MANQLGEHLKWGLHFAVSNERSLFYEQFGVSNGEEISALTDRLSIWASGNYSEAESTFTATAFESETTSGAVGLDYAVSDFATVGATVSYAETDTVSSFNGGGSDSEVYTIAPST